MKKLLIFDLDGTLLDTLEDLKSAVNFSLKKFGFPQRTTEQIEKSMGNGFRHLVSTSLPDSCGEDTLEAVLSLAREYYREHFHDATCPYEGILPLLEELKRESYPLCIVSNKPHPMVRCLRELFFRDLVAYAVGEIPGIQRKPDPEAIFAAMVHFNRTDAVYIGDSEVDIRTAENAGIPCISVGWGFRREADLRAAGAITVCATAEELRCAIKRL